MSNLFNVIFRIALYEQSFLSWFVTSTLPEQRQIRFKSKIARSTTDCSTVAELDYHIRRTNLLSSKWLLGDRSTATIVDFVYSMKKVMVTRLDGRFLKTRSLFWLQSPIKCPSNPEKDHISHSEQIWNTLAQSYYYDHFGPFWSISVHLMGDPMTPLHQIFIK